MRPAWIAGAAGALLLLAALLLGPRAALAGWRAAFLAGSAVPIGAVVLLLVARVTGAAWQAALLPLARAMPLVAIGFVPVAIEQALFVAPPPHLALWLAWPFFAGRSLAAIALWWWLGRRALTTTAAGLGLAAHAVVATIVGTDWLLGTAPGQPNSAAGMILAVSQILAACAAACVLRAGADTARRDLSYLLLAACLGLAYLVFIDFMVVWYGDLPARVGWYLPRVAPPWALLAPAALVIGLAGPIAAVVTRRRALAGGLALGGLLLTMLWEVGVPGAATAALAAAGGALLVAAGASRGVWHG